MQLPTEKFSIKHLCQMVIPDSKQKHPYFEANFASQHVLHLGDSLLIGVMKTNTSNPNFF